MKSEAAHGRRAFRRARKANSQDGKTHDIPATTPNKNSLSRTKRGGRQQPWAPRAGRVPRCHTTTSVLSEVCLIVSLHCDPTSTAQTCEHVTRMDAHAHTCERTLASARGDIPVGSLLRPATGLLLQLLSVTSTKKKKNAWSFSEPNCRHRVCELCEHPTARESDVASATPHARHERNFQQNPQKLHAHATRSDAITRFFSAANATPLSGGWGTDKAVTMKYTQESDTNK